jgi:hypothetical protein
MRTSRVMPHSIGCYDFFSIIKTLPCTYLYKNIFMSDSMQHGCRCNELVGIRQFMDAVFIIPSLEIEVGSADYVASRLINRITAHLSIATSVCVESRGRAATLSCCRSLPVDDSTTTYADVHPAAESSSVLHLKPIRNPLLTACKSSGLPSTPSLV